MDLSLSTSHPPSTTFISLSLSLQILVSLQKSLFCVPMERLIHSNAILSKPRLKPPPFLPLFSHFHSSKLGISFVSRTQFPRVNSISSKITNDPLNISSFNPTPVAKIPEKLNLGSVSSVDSSNGSGRKPELLNQGLDSISQLKKVCYLTNFII